MYKLNILLKELEELHPKFIDLSLSRINRLLKKLGNPHLKLPHCIHIAGTNGKGSTLNFIKNIMIESGYKVHAYISPHLEKINERFIISNKIITDKMIIKALTYVKKINNDNSITFYEITTATAFYLFSINKADFIILETGLGGRLDATNVIKKNLISSITQIGYDHKEYLGNSLYKITKEKLGIIKKNSIVIVSKQNNITRKRIKKFIKKSNNQLISYDDNWNIKNITKKYFYINVTKKLIKYNRPKLLGKHQIYNASTAIMAINTLKNYGYNFKKNYINKGIINTKWPGRLEIICKKNPIIIVDGSHNIDGARTLRKFILQSNYKTWLILGMLNTKDLYGYLKIIKNCINGIIAIEIPNEKNSISKKKIVDTCRKLKIKCSQENNIKYAIKKIIKNYNSEQIIITGSLYLVKNSKKIVVKLMNQSIH